MVGGFVKLLSVGCDIFVDKVYRRLYDLLNDLHISGAPKKIFIKKKKDGLS
jgi:hypothetical protein